MQRVYGRAEERKPGAGDELLSRVENATALLLRFPRMAAEWKFPVRRLVVRRSTLGLFYVPESRGIVIIAVADLRQDPDQLWQAIQGRMPE